MLDSNNHNSNRASVFSFNPFQALVVAFLLLLVFSSILLINHETESFQSIRHQHRHDHHHHDSSLSSSPLVVLPAGYEVSKRTTLLQGEGAPATRSNGKRRSHHKKKTTVSLRDGRRKIPLDFVVAGFPKSGTTSLLYTFAAHNETSIAQTEHCQFMNPTITDRDAFRKIDSHLVSLVELNSDTNQDQSTPRSKTKLKRKLLHGIKCPNVLVQARAIERIQNRSPHTKMIIGVRHPVFLLQSYYNYRITEIYDHNRLDETIPSLETVADSKLPWKGISMERLRFELYLIQLGKTNVTTADLALMANREYMAIKHTTFPVFLYSLDQMKDMDLQRSSRFRQKLQHFLQIDEPIPPLGRENKNHFVGNMAHKETIDICQDRYRYVRAKVVEQGRESAEWIRTEFAKSADVTIANPDHFFASISSWQRDPCVSTTDAVMKKD